MIDPPRNEKGIVGTDLTKRLRIRLRLPLSPDEDYTDDEMLFLEALETIERLRWRDPWTVEAERIIRSAAARLKEDKP